MDWLRSLPTFDDLSNIVVVDGGGTRSRAAVATADGKLLGYAEGGPTNQRSVGDEEAAGNVRDVIAGAVHEAGGDPVTAVLVSSASVDTAAHAAVLEGGVRACVGGGATVAVVADTIGCWAATAKLDPAVAVIAGTGSAVLGGSLDEGSRRYGGWDFMLGDEGSGFAIGRAALRETLLVAEERSRAERLAIAVEARLGIVETDELFDAVYKPEIDKAKVASFAGDVFRLAAEGDDESLGIIRDQAAQLADTVAAACRHFAAIGTVGCFGGIWNDDQYRAAFEAALHERLDRVPEIVHPGDTAMVGSYRLVQRHHADGEPGGAEDAAVDAFAAALAEAKDNEERTEGGTGRS